MKKIELYNLHIGSPRPGGNLSNGPIGPFTVKVVDDYEDQIEKLSKKPSKTTDLLTGDVAYKPGSPGEWTVTATAEFDESSENEKSILLRKDDSDNGLWDLCEILTFLTGRRVATEENRDRYNPNMYGERACIDVETLKAASIAWNNRQILKNKKIVYSLLYFNEILNQNSVQFMALCNTSLNIILDELVDEKDKVDKRTRKSLKADIDKVIFGSNLLTTEQKKAYSDLIGGKIGQGTSSLVGKLKDLLVQYEIVENPSDTAVEKRIKYINAVRNRLTHSGKLPDLKGLTSEQSDRYSINIVGGIVPELCRLVIGRQFGFTKTTAGSLCQYTDTLQKFFEDGIWNDWKLEEQSFEEYFYE